MSLSTFFSCVKNPLVSSSSLVTTSSPHHESADSFSSSFLVCERRGTCGWTNVCSECCLTFISDLMCRIPSAIFLSVIAFCFIFALTVLFFYLAIFAFFINSVFLSHVKRNAYEHETANCARKMYIHIFLYFFLFFRFATVIYHCKIF